METDLRDIFGFFDADGTFLYGEPYGNGHIHDTFRIVSAEDHKNDYILQRLNKRIFKNIPELQENIERVTVHLRKKILSIPGSNPARECLTLIPSKKGSTWITDAEGSFWRLYLFISDHHSYNIVDSPEKAYEGGKAIGRFQAMLADLPEPPLHETIPFFHNIVKRLETFENVIKADPAGRVKESGPEIEFISKRADQMRIILDLGQRGEIPSRITHNDTKFNNILLDSNDKALCVIDLDTVMQGYVHYDFGDAIRTAANIAAEDERELSKVKMDIRLFEAYAGGYLSETRETLNPVEKEYLAFAPRLITYTIATRFLTDWLDGDHYFKIHHEHHNLQRARAQMKLVESMELQYSAMQEIIKKLA